ncbi:MAG TPA: DegT/DnrJ/EryC1/StrS family aminotransferase [Polyangiaceae bacterium]|nr:DegT/DnrJ/EryC1/StrS family aminotransferase [Polyangiaceae bacterium]
MKPSQPSARIGATHTVPFFDLAAQTSELIDEIRPAMERVIQSQRFILGEEVLAFEREVADYLGVKHAIGVSSGTDALTIALAACGIGSGDEVITTPYTFFATTGAILRVGATPVFVDIERDSFNLDAERVSDALTSRTRAILPVHLFGQAADMRALRAIARQNQLALIEDAAQALGATLHGERVGTLGDLACFSFFPTKNLGGFGDGGLVTTNDDGLAELARSLRGHGFSAKHLSQRLGGNYRLDALQAAVLRVKLPYLERFNARRRGHARKYLQAGSCDALMLPEELPGRMHVYHQFVVRSRERDALAAHLAARGIATERYYPHPIHLQPACAHLGHVPGSFPEAEAAAQQSLALPIFPELEDWMSNAVADALASFSSSPEPRSPA